MNLVDNNQVIMYAKLSREYEKEEQDKEIKSIKLLINEKLKKLYKKQKNYLNLRYGKELPLFKTHEVTYQRSADGDEEYLERCMSFYESMGVKANGLALAEAEISTKILGLIKEFRPDIVVITGHDAYYAKKNDIKNLDNYQNTSNFISAIREVRKYEKNQDKLIVVAGACQSNYEELIKAGANFASSPKRINIHALDPAIIATSLALSDRNQSIDLISLIEKTKYGSDGIGGLITNGTMYVGYPR